MVGFSSRIMVNHYFDLNVFADCFSFISITYYFWMATFVVSVNRLVEVFDFSQFVGFLSFEPIKLFIAMWGQFTHHLTKFLSNLWKPTLFQTGYWRGGKRVETIKFSMDINSQTGSGSFKEVESNRDEGLFRTNSDNSFNTPSTMTSLFQSQNHLPQRSSNLPEQEWAIWAQVGPAVDSQTETRN